MASEQILVLEQGRIVESGTHQDLLGAGGRYSELWRNQQEREGEKERTINVADFNAWRMRKRRGGCVSAEAAWLVDGLVG